MNIRLHIMQTGIVCLLVLFQLQEATAQPLGFEVLSRRGRTTFAFEKVNNLIVIPVVLNERLPLKFILDTGVRSTILTDRTISDVINISYDRAVTIAGAGQVRELNAYLVSDIILSMPGINGYGQSMIVLEEDYLELGSHLGMDVHGIIGYEFFQHFIVRIDYDRKLITVYDPEVFRAGRRFTKIPITVEQGRPFICTTVTQYDGTMVHPKLLIDSGASHGVLLETDTDENIIMPEEKLKTIIGWGLGGELAGYLGRVKKLSVGEFMFKDVLTSFAEDYSDQTSPGAVERNGSMGGDLLSRFTVILDYREESIYLRKNRTFSFPFDFNMGGIDIVATGTEYNAFRVINVIESSPAYEAGVQNGDIILAVDGKFSNDLSLSEINYMLRTRPGRRITLLLSRDTELKRISFRLRRMI